MSKRFYGLCKLNLANPNKLPEITNHINFVVSAIPDDDGLFKGVVHIDGKEVPVFTIKDDNFDIVIAQCKAFIARCYIVKENNMSSDITPGYYIRQSLNSSGTYDGEVYYLDKIAEKIYKNNLFTISCVDKTTCEYLCNEAKNHLEMKGIKK